MSSNYNEFHLANFHFLKSYDSVIAKWDDKTKTLTLGQDWNFSRTTVKHLGIFLNNNTDRPERGQVEIQKAIDAGLIKYNPLIK